MPTRLAVAALIGLAVSARAQSTPAFAFPTPPLAGTFANVLRDHLHFTGNEGALRATGRLGEREVRLAGAATGGAFSGQATLGGVEAPCRGTFDGETLRLSIGGAEWRLQGEVALEASLAELGAPSVDAEREWTIAVYLGADNDLEDEALADLLEMRQGRPAKGVEVVVLLDRHREATDRPEDWSDTRVLRVAPGEAGTFETLGPPQERDMTDPVTLASFVTGVFRKFPARHHAVVIWDHGGGWPGICVESDPPPPPGTMKLLTLPSIRQGLRTALQQSGLLRLDLLAFDACLMAQLDVALSVHDLAEIMIASEASVPGTGFPYAKMLPKFAGEPSARAVAKAIVDEYGTFSDGAFDTGSTLSAFELRHAPGVAARLDALAAEAGAACATQWHAIARALFFAECYEVRQKRVADGAAASIDLIDLSSRLRGIPGIAEATLDALQLQVAALVFARYLGGERTLSKGLSIYGPHRDKQYRADYDRTPLGLGNRWRGLLREVHERGERDQSPITVGDFRQLDALGKPAAAARPFGGDRLLFTATGESLVEVQVHDWQHDPAEKRWLLLRKGLVVDPLWPARWATASAADMVDLVMPQFQPGRNELFHELAGLTFAITDGAKICYGTIDMTAPSTQAPFTAIARHVAKANGAKTVVQATFDRAQWHLVSLRPVLAIGGGALPRDLQLAPGDTLEFWFDTRSDSGEEGGFYTPALTCGDAGIALIAEADDPGRYRAEMVARTVAGRSATASHEYEIVANPDLEAWPASWANVDRAGFLGTWQQFKVTGPAQYMDLKFTCEVTASKAADLWQVVTRGGPQGDMELAAWWDFEPRGLPCLRIVTNTEDGQRFGWYGPVRWLERDGKKVLVMKAVNASGVVWEWRKP